MGSDTHEDTKLSGTEDRQAMGETGTSARFGKRSCNNGGKEAGQLRQTQMMVLPTAQQGYPDNQRPGLHRGHQEAQEGLQPESSSNCVTQRRFRWRRWAALGSAIALSLLTTGVIGDRLHEDLVNPSTTDVRRSLTFSNRQKPEQSRLGEAPTFNSRCLDESKGGEEVPGIESFPSTRCASREEWQDECLLWSGEPHNRYVEFANLRPKEGLGANLLRVHWALNRALLFDLQPVFVGPILASHGTGDFGDWMGLTNNPILAVRDHDGFKSASRQEIPFPEGNGEDWFRDRRNQTSVVYVTDPMKVEKIKDWGVPVTTAPSDSRVCRYARQALRGIFWSVPGKRNRCDAFLAEKPEFLARNENHVSEIGKLHIESQGSGPEMKRPWIVALHIRRGDMIKFREGVRSVPHAYFVATAKAVLRGIAEVDPEARASILIFSEGPEKLEEDQLMDEMGRVVTWDISPDCEVMGLRCTQEIILGTSLFDTFDCLATADVVVGSESSMSEAAAAVSTNVKVMLWEGQKEQDRVTLKCNEIATAGEVSPQDQMELNAAISNWFHCEREARLSTGVDSASEYARRFYEMVHLKS